MADKQIYELDASSADLTDAALVAGGVGTASAKKYTGLELRAKEKGEREAQDDVIEAGVGLNGDGTYNGFAGSNYLDASTSTRDALSKLDTAIGILGSLDARVGTESLTADTPLIIVLNASGVPTPYADTDYIIPIRNGYDPSGYIVPVIITSKTVNGFTAEANFDCTFEYATFHL